MVSYVCLSSQSSTNIFQLMSYSSNIFLPRHILGPSPNGMNASGCLLALFSGRNLSGSYLSGSGKCSGSFCIDLKGTMIEVPASRTKSVPGTLYSFLHTLDVYNTGEYLRSDSAKRKKKSSN